MATPFLINDEIAGKLAKLRELANQRPVDMPGVMKAIKTLDGKKAHMDRMTEQTIDLSFGFMVTFSIEIGHPGGAMRHMSMSAPRKGRVPHPIALWWAAEQLGFIEGLEACHIWQEDLQGHGVAINLAQPIDLREAETEKTH